MAIYGYAHVNTLDQDLTTRVRPSRRPAAVSFAPRRPAVPDAAGEPSGINTSTQRSLAGTGIILQDPVDSAERTTGIVMATLSGCRILVAEDEQLIAMMIEETLSDEGCVVVGPFDRVNAALTSATTDNLDGALLDVRLHGADVYPVAEALATRGIPFILLSGLGDLAVPREHPNWTVCGKPFTPDGLVEVMLTHFRPGLLAGATSRVDPRGETSGT